MAKVPLWLQRKADAVNQAAKSRGYRSFMSSEKMYDIYLRQDGACSICGSKLVRNKCIADHIVPLACGGEVSHINNIQLLCPSCNNEKMRSEASRDGRRALQRITIIIRVFDGYVEARGDGSVVRCHSVEGALEELTGLILANTELPWIA